MPFFDNFKDKEHLTVAHRGNRSLRAENTMHAFEEALGLCDFLEFDVCFTKDKIAVVLHDNTIIRTSNALEFFKNKNKIKAMNIKYKKLKKLDFSSWFIKIDPFFTIKNKIVNIKDIKKQKISTLEEVLVFCKKNKICANIEIKNLKGTPFHKTCVEDILKIVQEIAYEDYVLISSFNHKYLKQIKEYKSKIQTAALQEKNHPDNLLEYLKELDVASYNCCDKIITKDIVEELKKENIFVNVFTVNDEKRKKELFSFGVKSIFTDFL